MAGLWFEEFEDGMAIEGSNSLGGGTIDSRGDHRIAMSFAMAALRASAPVHITDCANVDTSFPGFAALATAAGVRIDVRDRHTEPGQ